MNNAESNRLQLPEWKKWGPYLSERQWGTVREDHSEDGNVWKGFTHDDACSKVYWWGEDGIGGFCDDRQLLCVSLALWNGKDPILKERLFGLTNEEGNHGEDVKEVYYYLDNTPTHSYQRMLYRYPQSAYPYEQLLEENKRRSRADKEFELVDTGIFDNGAYFDVFIEYAKKSPNDILIRYSVYNTSDKVAHLHLLPQLWFRNAWSSSSEQQKPSIESIAENTLQIQHEHLGMYHCYAENSPAFLFTENESNTERLQNQPNRSAYVKDGIHRRVVNNDKQAVNERGGTKAAIWYRLEVAPNGKSEVRLRLCSGNNEKPFEDFTEIFTDRIAEANLFYEAKQKNTASEEQPLQRQAWSGLLWNKQFYNYNVLQWLTDDARPHSISAISPNLRNQRWRHFRAHDIISMPDKWEYPWFAAWDLAFQAIAFAPIDAVFAKQQLLLLLDSRYMHPNGQIPAYEWDFGDINPPLQAFAALKIYVMDKDNTGVGDTAFLEEVFQKLLLNFTWWVNREDSEGNNIFEGGFLGLDNISIFNRSEPFPGGGFLEQADGTSWMAMYTLNMFQIATELSLQKGNFEPMAVKFIEHFFYIAGTINQRDNEQLCLWDEGDGFYYDLLRKPDGSLNRLRLRSLVGIIPLFATAVFKENIWDHLPLLKRRMLQMKEMRPDLFRSSSELLPSNGNGLHLISLVDSHKLERLLQRIFDPAEFLSAFGVRSLSKVYETQPYSYWLEGRNYSVQYVSGESTTAMYGGNSNWRGPIWMPINYLLIESLKTFYSFYGKETKFEFPTGSQNPLTLQEISTDISKRLKNLFVRKDENDITSKAYTAALSAKDNSEDYFLFYEYFDGNTGEGLGASHQTGWTALITLL